MNRFVAAVGAAFIAFAGGLALAADAPPTDAQIAHIAYTAGVIDIDVAKVALDKAENADVKAFAEMMIKDHQAVNDQALALVDKLGITPEDNPTSQALNEQAAAEKAKLEALSGAEFDKAYIENEVAFHKQVLDALDGTLIPATQNAELKALLESGSKLFHGHELHAEQVAGELK